jgi:DNA invertase Pin-like site-specific DNA recombinase
MFKITDEAHLKRFILENYRDKTTQELSEQSNQFKYIVIRVCKELGVKPITLDERSNAFLLSHYESMSREQMAEELKMSLHSINKRCNKLGLVNKPIEVKVMPVIVPIEEVIDAIDQELLLYHKSMSKQALANKLKVTTYQITKRCNKLGIQPLSMEEITKKAILHLHTSMTCGELANSLEVTKGEIIEWCNALGVQPVPDKQRKLDFIHRHQYTMSRKAMAEALSCSIGTIDRYCGDSGAQPIPDWQYYIIKYAPIKTIDQINWVLSGIKRGKIIEFAQERGITFKQRKTRVKGEYSNKFQSDRAQEWRDEGHI